MNVKKPISALILIALAAASASCGEPNVVFNIPDPNGVPNLQTSAATMPEPETSAFQTTDEEEQTSEAETETTGGDSSMVPDPYYEELQRVLSAKTQELDMIVFGSIQTEDGMIAALGTENGDNCDIWLIKRTGTELLLSLPRSQNLTGVTMHVEDDKQFLIVYEKGVMGRGYPATILTIKDTQPLVLSQYDPNMELMPPLFYLPNADLVCVRGYGLTIGSNSVIPYHWDGNDFVPYRLRRISVSELKALDTDNVVINANGAVSIYRRENGLVHVNYLEMSEVQEAQNDAYTAPPIASRTYVYEDGKLRAYDYDSEKDTKYGFFPEVLPVTDNTDGSQSFEIQG